MTGRGLRRAGGPGLAGARRDGATGLFGLDRLGRPERNQAAGRHPQQDSAGDRGGARLGHLPGRRQARQGQRFSVRGGGGGPVGPGRRHPDRRFRPRHLRRCRGHAAADRRGTGHPDRHAEEGRAPGDSELRQDRGRGREGRLDVLLRSRRGCGTADGGRRGTQRRRPVQRPIPAFGCRDRGATGAPTGAPTNVATGSSATHLTRSQARS